MKLDWNYWQIKNLGSFWSGSDTVNYVTLAMPNNSFVNLFVIPPFCNCQTCIEIVLKLLKCVQLNIYTLTLDKMFSCFLSKQNPSYSLTFSINFATTVWKLKLPKLKRESFISTFLHALECEWIWYVSTSSYNSRSSSRVGKVVDMTESKYVNI